MRRAEHSLEVLTAVGVGSPQVCATYIYKWVGVSGTFVATMVVEGQIVAGGPWYAVATLSAPGVLQVDPTFNALRVNVTAFTSGAPVASLVAFDARTD